MRTKVRYRVFFFKEGREGFDGWTDGEKGGYGEEWFVLFACEWMARAIVVWDGVMGKYVCYRGVR
jgi:hypothetical protein